MVLRPAFPQHLFSALRRLQAALFCLAILPLFACAQDAAPVPHLVEFNGTIADPPPGTAAVTFALYADQTDRVPLWQETQTVAVDAAGHYLALLGAASPEGIPLEVFRNGEARWLGVTVEGRPELPSYFEALNQDFRYQLTVIGQFAQAIVAREIANNRFTIQTDKPAVKVSWQVTGIRHDAYAEAHRVQVEEEKPASERGTYLHPELFTPQPDRPDKK